MLLPLCLKSQSQLPNSLLSSMVNPQSLHPNVMENQELTVFNSKIAIRVIVVHTKRRFYVIKFSTMLFCLCQCHTLTFLTRITKSITLKVINMGSTYSASSPLNTCTMKRSQKGCISIPLNQKILLILNCQKSQVTIKSRFLLLFWACMGKQSQVS